MASLWTGIIIILVRDVILWSVRGSVSFLDKDVIRNILIVLCGREEATRFRLLFLCCTYNPSAKGSSCIVLRALEASNFLNLVTGMLSILTQTIEMNDTII